MCKPLSKILPNIGPPFPTSCVGQFHRLFRNWNLHSSMAILAPFCRANIVPGCFVTSFLCFLVNGKRLGLLYSCVLDLRSFDGFPMLASVLKATQKINLFWNYFMALENLFIVKSPIVLRIFLIHWSPIRSVLSKTILLTNVVR